MFISLYADSETLSDRSGCFQPHLSGKTDNTINDISLRQMPVKGEG
jgi:hypothetical protein